MTNFKWRGLLFETTEHGVWSVEINGEKVLWVTKEKYGFSAWTERDWAAEKEQYGNPVIALEAEMAKAEHFLSNLAALQEEYRGQEAEKAATRKCVV